MRYPGNPSLQPDVQKRALTTFVQSLQLVSQGRDQEALTGCEFVLRLDPHFQMAKTLQQRLQSPQRPVALDDLIEHLRSLKAQSQPAAAQPQAAAPQPQAAAPQPQPAAQPQAAAPRPQPAAPQATDTVRLPAGSIAAAPAPQGGDTIRMSAVGPEAPAPQAGDTIRMESVGELAPLDDGVELGGLDDFGVPAEPSGPPPPTVEATPVGETVLELVDEPSLELVAEPVEIAEEDSGLGGDDDFLALQQQSLSLDQEHDDPLSQIDGDVPDLESLDLDDDEELPDLDDEPLALDEPLDLGGEESLDLGGEEPLELGGGESVEFGGGEAVEFGGGAALEFGEDPPLELGSDEALDLGGGEALDLGGGEALDLGGGEALDLGGGESIGVAPEAAPPEAAPPPASAGGDEEGQDRIDQLLAEGQEVFDRGDYQGAIDVWSRIFLIDVTHGEASRRIEEARKKKAELERQAEEHFHEAVAFIEQQSLDEAKEALRRVLEIDASHSLAREYLQQLEAGQVPAVKSRSADVLDSDLDGELLDGGAGEGAGSLEAAVQRDRVVVVKKTDKRLVLAGVAVTVLLVGGGGWLILNKDKLFPNTQTESAGPRRIDPIARATALYEEGKSEQALAVLRKVPVADPAYQDALALIDQWEAQKVEEVVDTGPPPELLARREKILEAARRAHEAHHYIRARRYFDSAAKILALEASDQAWLDDCDHALLPLAEAIDKYEEREYAEILPDLWRQLDKEPDNHDVVLLIVDSYYNLALTDLQRGDPRSAAEKLTDALDADPENEELRRMQLFAETYSTRSPDLLYAIFVKYMPSR